MLVLSRKLQESIIIGNDIQITVVNLQAGKVRLGIKAPPGVPIYRSELSEVERKGIEQSTMERGDDHAAKGK